MVQLGSRSLRRPLLTSHLLLLTTGHGICRFSVWTVDKAGRVAASPSGVILDSHGWVSSDDAVPGTM